MKKKRVEKVAKVKQHEAVQEEVQEEVKTEEQPQRKVHPLSAWDDLMFMGRRPRDSEAATSEDSAEEK